MSSEYKKVEFTNIKNSGLQTIKRDVREPKKVSIINNYNKEQIKEQNINITDPIYISSDNTNPMDSLSTKKGPVRRVRLGAEYGHAMFSDQEWEDLKKDFPTDYLERVRQIDEYCEQTGKTYRNYYLTIKKWDQNAKERNKKPKSASELKISADEWKKEEL